MEGRKGLVGEAAIRRLCSPMSLMLQSNRTAKKCLDHGSERGKARRSARFPQAAAGGNRLVAPVRAAGRSDHGSCGLVVGSVPQAVAADRRTPSPTAGVREV